MLTRFLRWADVDPKTHRYDRAAVARVVRPLVAAAAAEPAGKFRSELYQDLHRVLIVECGPWVDGWSWTNNEPGGGGPVHGFCCSTHSLLPADDDDTNFRDPAPVADTTARIIAAIDDWRSCLGEIASLFEVIASEAPATPGTSDLETEIEHAASRVLPFVIQRTGAEDAWYATFTQILSWYLERAGHDPDLARPAIANTIKGQFQSWGEPAADVAEQTCRAIGRAVVDANDDPPVRDALAAWLDVRKQEVTHLSTPRRVPVPGDGHQRYIDTIDRARDPERADRLSAALVLCRDSATRRLPLTVDQLCEWQAIVLGHTAELRTGPAFAKGGRETYGYRPKLRRELEDALAEAGTKKTQLSVRAARVYLDVCFYHPFSDGNARAARLALDHVLTSAGMALHAAEPVFVVSRAADDRHVLWSLAYVIEQLIGPIE